MPGRRGIQDIAKGPRSAGYRGTVSSGVDDVADDQASDAPLVAVRNSRQAVR